MDDLLTPLKTVQISSQGPSEEHLRQGTQEIRPNLEPTRVRGSISSPDDVLQILTSQPSQEYVLQIIQYLHANIGSRTGFDIRNPGPQAARVLNVLVSTTIPDHWGSLYDSSQVRKTASRKKINPPIADLVECLASVAGIGALLAQIKIFLRARNNADDHVKTSQATLKVKTFILVLQTVLDTPDLVSLVWSETLGHAETMARREVIWREFLSLVAGGKVLSTVSEAYRICKDHFNTEETIWLGNGSLYAGWIGRATSSSILRMPESDLKAVSQLFGRSLSLGHPDLIIEEVVFAIVLGVNRDWGRLQLFLKHLQVHEQTSFLRGVISTCIKRYLPNEYSKNEVVLKRKISGVAFILHSFIQGNDILEEYLSEWLSKSDGGSREDINIRRAAIAAISPNLDRLQQILEKSMQTFGDKLFIRHSSILQQEASTQVVLLTAGYVYRNVPTFVKGLSRSSIHLNAISNRLSASSARSRFLGMVVGVAISRLVDPPEQSMKFDLDGTDSGDSNWYLNLTRVEDPIGSIDDLDTVVTKSDISRKPQISNVTKAPLKKSVEPTTQTSKIISIEEISDEDESEDDLISYDKPDSDAEDSEEDPTLIQRNKPTAPVYIRDLVAGLRDSESYDRYRLAIITAPSLIRRKSGFGTEVSENVEELALQLVGLQDKYNLEKFEEFQLQGMIAVLIAQPRQMAPWFTRTLFDGDISIAQRMAILTTLGLGARELAGFREEDAKVMGLPSLPSTSFPSQRLPDRLHATYGTGQASQVGQLAKDLSERSLKPLALDAADKLVGPNALKVRTFSSRMEVEKRRKKKETEASRARNKDVSKILSENFILPLTGRFGLTMRSWTHPHNPFLTPTMLISFLQTLTLILHTLGPSAPSLTDVTHECLPILFSIRSLSTAIENSVQEALLAAFLALIDLNTANSTLEERLVTDYPREVTELRGWADGVFNRTPTSEEKLRMLAAGVMVKIGEVAERWERRFLGAGYGF